MTIKKPMVKTAQTVNRRRSLGGTMVVAAALMLMLVRGTGRAGGRELAIYRPAALADGTVGGRITVPYTFGTHDFEVHQMSGEVRVAWDTPVSASGRLTVPLAFLRGGGSTLNCHMREALGLDYSKSAFPGEHVCSRGQLPASGKDAVAFPELAFDITGVTLVGDPARVGVGGRLRVSVSGRFTIHGFSRDDMLDLWMTVGEWSGGRPRTLLVEGAHTIRLSDYGIRVKRALMISAGEQVTVSLNLLLNEVR